MGLTPSNPENDRAAAIEQMRSWYVPTSEIGAPTLPVECPLCGEPLDAHASYCVMVPAPPEALERARYQADSAVDDWDDWLAGARPNFVVEFWGIIASSAADRLADARHRATALDHYLHLLAEATS